MWCQSLAPSLELGVSVFVSESVCEFGGVGRRVGLDARGRNTIKPCKLLIFYYIAFWPSFLLSFLLSFLFLYLTLYTILVYRVFKK